MNDVHRLLNEIQTLKPDEIRQRLNELDREEKTLRMFLRLILRGQPIQESSHNDGRKVAHVE